MLIIFGTRYFYWGSLPTAKSWRCGKCGFVGQFTMQQGMQFFTLFFIPVIPLSAKTYVTQCPSCDTRYMDSLENQVACKAAAQL